MKAWEKLREHLLATRTVLEDEGERIMLAHKYADPSTSKTLTQRVQLSLRDVVGKPWVLFLAEGCSLVDIHPHRALVHNATLAVGSLVVEDGTYFLRHSTPLTPLDAASLDLIIDLLAHEGARLRSRRPLAV